MKSAVAPSKLLSNKPVLAIDFDDVFVPYAHKLIEAYNREHGGSIRIENIYIWDKFGNSSHGWKHDAKGALQWIHGYLARPESLEVEPIAGSVAALQNLRRKYTIAVVTGRPPKIDHIMHKWLERHMPGVVDQIYHVADTPKSVTCKQIEAKCIVDDNPVYIHDCHTAGIEVIVFGDYPWNQADRLPENAPRARDWAEVERLLL
jgi:5'(3')-deoxyribonucleotidase